LSPRGGAFSRKSPGVGSDSVRELAVTSQDEWRRTNMWYSRRRWLAALVAAIFVGSACSGAPAEGDGIPERGATIQVGSTMDLAPLDFVDEQGEPTGYELDVVMAVAEDLGYELEWVKTPFEQAFTGLLAEKYRFNASAIYTRCARIQDKENFGVFTVPVGQAGQAVTTTTDLAGQITSMEDLAGKTLGVESAGSTADSVADENISIGYTKEIFPDNNALFLALEQGRIDAAMQSEDVSRYTIRDKPGLQVAFVLDDTRLSYGWVFRADDPLRERFNESINKLKEDGTIPAIYEEWFGVPPPEGDPASTVVPEVTEATCRG
jgi:ABC-type amino acid transport substrate-binding protein